MAATTEGGRAAANDVADDDGICRFNQYFGNGAYTLTSLYGTGKGRPPAWGAFLVYADGDYVGPFRKSKKKENNGSVSGGTVVPPPPPSPSIADPPRDSRTRIPTGRRTGGRPAIASRRPSKCSGPPESPAGVKCMTSCVDRTDPSTWGCTFTTHSRGTVGSVRCAGGKGGSAMIRGMGSLVRLSGARGGPAGLS